MSVPIVLGIAVLGGAASVLRVLIAAAITHRTESAFPYGTLAVNLSGALALGLATGAGLHGDAHRLLATGALGAYTTFSTWMLESHGRRIGALNVALSLALGLLAAWIGRESGAAL